MRVLHQVHPRDRIVHASRDRPEAVIALLVESGQVPARLGNRHPTIVPYESFRAADGEFVIAGGNDEIWRRLCRVIGRPELADDPEWATPEARR